MAGFPQLGGSEELLGLLIETELAKAVPGYKPDPQTLKIWTAVGTAIINHIVSNGQVFLDTGVVAVAGTAAAQSNPAPVIGKIK